MRKLVIISILVTSMCMLLACGKETSSPAPTKDATPTQEVAPSAESQEPKTDAEQNTQTGGTIQSSSITGVQDLTEEEKDYSYGKAVMQDPELVLPAEDWIMEDGSLWYPFDLHKQEYSAQQLLTRCYIGKSVLKKASTENLIQLLQGLWPVDSFTFSNPGFYEQYLVHSLNATNELLSRDDLGSTLLAMYKNASIVEGMTSEEENNLIVLETLLAKESVYLQLSDEERAEVLAQATKLMEDRENVSNLNRMSSAFFSGIFGYQMLYSENAWIDYVNANGNDDAKAQLTEDWN